LVLARGVREVTGGRIMHALARRHRPSQVGLPMSERRRNVSGTMRLRGRAQLGGGTGVVMDGVPTTGASVAGGRRAPVRGLKARGTPAGEVWAAVLGVAVERPRDVGVAGGQAAEPG